MRLCQRRAGRRRGGHQLSAFTASLKPFQAVLRVEVGSGAGKWRFAFRPPKANLPFLLALEL